MGLHYEWHLTQKIWREIIFPFFTTIRARSMKSMHQPIKLGLFVGMTNHNIYTQVCI